MGCGWGVGMRGVGSGEVVVGAVRVVVLLMGLLLWGERGQGM